ncbi:MAG TPA: beta-lactamase family protein, partial [Epulopiscium sp.]|nr:beta-lactamase family protein [Candidatus Epulonipiscium sp.]
MNQEKFSKLVRRFKTSKDNIVDIDPFTYLDHLINEPIKHQPGKYYLYSNAGFYLLSGVLFLNETLHYYHLLGTALIVLGV